MTKSKAKENPTIVLIFARRCLLRDGKEGRVYYEVTEDELENGPVDVDLPWASRERVYGADKGLTRNMGGSPGMAYRVEVPADDPETTIYTSTARYAGQWIEQEKRAEWQMLDSVAGQEIALMKRARKAKNQDDVLECLEPIREAYRRARGAQRSLLLARAVQYITRG